jgi:hypothetical protein
MTKEFLLNLIRILLSFDQIANNQQISTFSRKNVDFLI